MSTAAMKIINADFGKWSAYEKGDFSCGELVLVDGKTYSSNEEMEYCLHPTMMKFIFEDSYDLLEDDENIVLYVSIVHGTVPQLEEEITRRGSDRVQTNCLFKS